MTGLGAAIYGGFFALAALWLFLTSDYAGMRFRRERSGGMPTSQTQAPERSNSTNTAATDDWSSEWLVSQSSSK
jgi:hypothetical protein